MEEQNKKNQKAKKKTIKRFVLIEEKTMVEENIKINREKSSRVLDKNRRKKLHLLNYNEHLNGH